MFAIVYYPQNNGKLPVHIDLWVTGIALAGTLLGQVFPIRRKSAMPKKRFWTEHNDSMVQSQNNYSANYNAARLPPRLPAVGILEHTAVSSRYDY